jgi:exonuclease III
MSPRSTTLLNWNANGLKSHRNALLAFLNHLNIDIACITETHLSNTDKLKFPGYKMYRADRVTQIRAKGGVAILVRNQIVVLSSQINNTQSELTTVPLTSSLSLLVYPKVPNLVLFYLTFTFPASLNHHAHKLLSSLMIQQFSQNHATSKQYPQICKIT